MIHMKDTLLLKSQLRYFCALILHHTVVLLLLTHSDGGAVSSPDTEIPRGVVLQCESKVWYPEPELLWLDGEGNVLSAGPTETLRGPDDLYTVSSRVTVEKRHSNSFTCRVQHKNTNLTSDTTIHLPADLFPVQSNSAVRITIFLAVCIMSVVTVFFAVRKWGRNKIQTTSSSIELQLLMGVDGDRDKPMTGSEKMAYLDNTKAKLDEDLQKNEGELKHVQQVIKTLTDQKTNLKSQRQKLISLLQEDKSQIEENKRKLKETPTFVKGNKMHKREKTKQDLEKRQKEHDELLQNTEKLLETTDEMIIKISERKAKLERDKEPINQHLKETERQREEVQRELRSEQPEREEERKSDVFILDP